MGLKVLNVAYPLAPVGPDAAGGAEQVLWQLDNALTKAGHTSLVIACEGSTTAGVLIPAGKPPLKCDTASRAVAIAEHRRAIAAALKLFDIDLIHLHGIDFHQYLPPPGKPVLITLHLPPDWYPPAVFEPSRPNTFIVCVSQTQRRACPPSPMIFSTIVNGVDVHQFTSRHARRRFALCLGRICPEKGFHLALEAATRAQVPLLIAGHVFPYEEHESYFQKEILPRLAPGHRFIGRAGLTRKRRLLSAARCLLVPSLAPETSSLVAMEALACGTPVIAFPSGALTEIVEPGRTGFLVKDAGEMAQAIHRCDSIDAAVCRNSAAQRFSLDTMIKNYFALYQLLAEGALRQSEKEENGSLGRHNSVSDPGYGDTVSRRSSAA